MRVYKYTNKTGGQWTRFDNMVYTIDRAALADGAKVMYGFLAGWKANGKPMTRAYIMKCLDIKESTYTKYINQLKKLDLVLVVRIANKSYDCYVGNTEIGASVVQKFWKELDEIDASSPISIDELKIMQAKAQL